MDSEVHGSYHLASAMFHKVNNFVCLPESCIQRVVWLNASRARTTRRSSSRSVCSISPTPRCRPFRETSRSSSLLLSVSACFCFLYSALFKLSLIRELRISVFSQGKRRCLGKTHTISESWSALLCLDITADCVFALQLQHPIIHTLASTSHQWIRFLFRSLHTLSALIAATCCLRSTRAICQSSTAFSKTKPRNRFALYCSSARNSLVHAFLASFAADSAERGERQVLEHENPYHGFLRIGALCFPSLGVSLRTCAT